MALDLRANRAEFPHRCKFYKGNMVENRQLVKDAIAQGIFYANDVVVFAESAQITGNLMSHRVGGSIATPDNVDDLAVNDYVDFDDSLYLVEEVSRKDLNTKSKQYSKRPITLTTLKIRR